jgi:hypothetical protein
MMRFNPKNGNIHIIYEYLLSLMKFIKKLISYELDSIIKFQETEKDPFIYR